MALIIRRQYTDFYDAICSGDALRLYLYMRKGVGPDTLIDVHDRTALMLAVLNDRADVVEVFLEKEPDVFKKDQYGYTVLDMAAMDDNVEISKLLCEYADLYVESTEYFSGMLGQFVVNSNLEMVKYLLEKGADPLMEVDMYRNALAEAIYHFDPANPEILISILQSLIDKGTDIVQCLEDVFAKEKMPEDKKESIRNTALDLMSAKRRNAENNTDPTRDIDDDVVERDLR